jgi:DNA-directed RNA polymerase specialized sigma24 family protein
LEKAITKDILRDELFSGDKSPAELLYNRYGGMLFGYVEQFISCPAEAESLLVNIFTRLSPRLDEAFESSLSVYCWLQIEARKIILEHREQYGSGADVTSGESKAYYLSLLKDASSEHRWVFRELFIHGRQREELAREAGRDQAYVEDLLKDCMQMIRKRLG